MTSVHGMVDGFPGGIRRSYISTDTFNTVFYTYANNTLTPLAAMYASFCPPGRILRENGKKLFPNSTPGVTQYYVGVYDATTFFNGFIDPNDAHFTVFNTDKPVYVPDNFDFGNSMPDLGPSVYTQGNVIAELAPNQGNFIGIINSTLTSYYSYSKLFFRNGLPVAEVGNTITGNYANLSLANSSTPTVVAIGDNPYIIAEGTVANIICAGYSNATASVISQISTASILCSGLTSGTISALSDSGTASILSDGAVNATITALNTTTNNGFIQMAIAGDTPAFTGYASATSPSFLLSTPQAVIGANFAYNGTTNLGNPQIFASNGNYYTSMFFTSNNNSGYIEAGSTDFLSKAGLDGSRGDLYATGMLNLQNSVGYVQLFGGTATIPSNNIFGRVPFIFLSYRTNDGTNGILSYVIQGDNSVTVNSSNPADDNIVNWLAVCQIFPVN